MPEMQDCEEFLRIHVSDLKGVFVGKEILASVRSQIRTTSMMITFETANIAEEILEATGDILQTQKKFMNFEITMPGGWLDYRHEWRGLRIHLTDEEEIES